MEQPSESVPTGVESPQKHMPSTANEGTKIPSDKDTYMVPIKEIELLFDYAVHRGIDPEEKTLSKLSQAISAYKLTGNSQSRAQVVPQLIEAYTTLAKMTYDSDRINGKTLADTNHAKPIIRKILGLGIVILLLVSLTEILNLWRVDFQEPVSKPTWLRIIDFLHLYVLTYLSPFFWGALGSVVFLAKRLSDEIRNFRFDLDRFQGFTVRVGLGGVLGGIFVSIYNPGAFSEAGLHLDTNALAFFAGVGVKAVYGAIEKTIETLAEKMNLQSIRQAKPKK